jgi:hypothetical protein
MPLLPRFPLSTHRYGVGIAAGISVVGWLKRKIQQLPVVGLLASPFLSKWSSTDSSILFAVLLQDSLHAYA